MSIQFGRLNFDGKPVDRDYLENVNALTAPYGPDGGSSYSKGNVSILYHALHTSKESRRETQPHLCASGAVMTWDGRLDNRAELIHELRTTLTIASTDVEIVAGAYDQWGYQCLGKLLGDWAICVWNPNNRSLMLAKDPIGPRHLYYLLDKDQLSWSTTLDPLVLCAGKTFALCEEYIAGWFSFFPATHLTPYVGIHAVPPSSYVLISPGKHTVNKYWDFDPGKRIHYRTDSEYEEQFRTVFGEAVRRRLRSDSPILAELSGGMDSSSIVCMGDAIIAHGAAETPRLDTVSYYNEDEPNWNERPYFTKVEEKRGRSGCHIEVRSDDSFRLDFDSDRFAATPGAGNRPNESAKKLAACVTSNEARVLLSGIGGDEVTGGVPTPLPELENLLATARFGILVHQLKGWALNKRKPWFHLLFEATRGFFPPALVGVPKHKRPAPWLTPAFVKRNLAALQGYGMRLKLFGPLPSFQGGLGTLDGLRRQLGCSPLPSGSPHEKWYPYLDRGLLEFVYAIPREQLVRPGQRRSLMRRALVGIVPDELLNRKRKAYVSRAPMAAITSEYTNLVESSRHMVSVSLGIVHPKEFPDALHRARCGEEVPIVALMRTVAVESWLRSARDHGVLNGAASTKAKDAPPLEIRRALLGNIHGKSSAS